MGAGSGRPAFAWIAASKARCFSGDATRSGADWPHNARLRLAANMESLLRWVGLGSFVDRGEGLLVALGPGLGPGRDLAGSQVRFQLREDGTEIVGYVIAG